MPYECQECGKTIEDKRGFHGHAKFQDGGEHGEKGELPEGYESLFQAIDIEGNGSSGDTETKDGGNGGTSDTSTPKDDGDTTNDESPGILSRINKTLFTT